MVDSARLLDDLANLDDGVDQASGGLAVDDGDVGDARVSGQGAPHLDSGRWKVKGRSAPGIRTKLL